MVIERSGAEVGMITTAASATSCTWAPQAAANILAAVRRALAVEPLVKRSNRLVVSERIMPPTGAVACTLAEDEVKEAAELFAKRARRRHRGVPVLVLNNHARAARQGDRQIDPAQCVVSCSSDVVNTIRE